MRRDGRLEVLYDARCYFFDECDQFGNFTGAREEVPFAEEPADHAEQLFFYSGELCEVEDADSETIMAPISAESIEVSIDYVNDDSLPTCSTTIDFNLAQAVPDSGPSDADATTSHVADQPEGPSRKRQLSESTRFFLDYLEYGQVRISPPHMNTF